MNTKLWKKLGYTQKKKKKPGNRRTVTLCFVGTRIFTGTVGTRGPKSPGTYFFMKKVFKKSLTILKYSLGILFYAPIGCAAICLAIVYL